MFSYKSFLDPSLTGKFYPSSYKKRVKVHRSSESVENKIKHYQLLTPAKIDDLGSHITLKQKNQKNHQKFSYTHKKDKNMSFQGMLPCSPNISLSNKFSKSKSPLLKMKYKEAPNPLHSSFDITHGHEKSIYLGNSYIINDELSQSRAIKLPKIKAIIPKMPQISMMDEIEYFHSKVNSKYEKIYELINADDADKVNKQILIDYLSSDNLGFSDCLLEPWNNDENMKVNIEEYSHKASIIIRTFAIINKENFDKEEFLAVCSVHEHFFGNKNLDFSDNLKMYNLRKKIKDLRTLFNKWTETNIIESDRIVNICKSIELIYDETDCFCEKLYHTKFSFLNFLKWIPLFMKIYKYKKNKM
ncbi:unnamed protein product [Blepharisma stoltei]|uniref:Uncharacterized protein n=1 Tax=Blepharisma stoltei TaxID=1481888 RepID=A0AAU9K357_9CILI|nr:unnamed protein product [Blepharisma stoltei]